MNYEKKYKEALAHAREIHRNEEEKRRDMEFIFPELAESEDERIRTELINGFKECLKNSQYPKNAQKYWHNIKIEDILAWLEKQGEKLPVGFYYVNSDGKKFYSDTFKYGDVILHVEKQGEQKPAMVEPKFKVGDIIRLKDGDGLEWTVEEVLNNGYYTIVCADRDDFIQLDDKWELVGQKPAWNEEDEVKINRIVACLENLNVADNDILLKDIDWLKSLKERIGG